MQKVKYTEEYKRLFPWNKDLNDTFTIKKSYISIQPRSLEELPLVILSNGQIINEHWLETIND